MLQKQRGNIMTTKSLTVRQNKLIEEALAIQEEAATVKGYLGFITQALAQITLPHTNQNTTVFSRTNGRIKLSIVSPEYGLPYGSIPRLILGWLCTEVVRTKSLEISLGTSQSEFLKKIGLENNGRDIARLKNQALRLFDSVITVYTNIGNQKGFEKITLAKNAFIFWNSQDPDQRSVWNSTLTITRDFYNEIIKSPVPIDLRVLHALSKSPLAMDIYTWLNYRMFLLKISRKREVLIPWNSLKNQFGSTFAENLQGLRDFKKQFKKRLREVLLFYPEATEHVDEMDKHLRLTPCKLHLKQKQIEA